MKSYFEFSFVRLGRNMSRDRCSIIRVSSLLRAADTENQIESSELDYFSIEESIEQGCKNRGKYAFDRVSRANYIFEKIRKFLEYLSSSTPHSVDEHRGFGWTRLQFESNRPGRYLMKRQSHFRIAISNSARQRRTRGRARRKEQRTRSRDKIIKTPLPRFVLKR